MTEAGFAAARAALRARCRAEGIDLAAPPADDPECVLERWRAVEISGPLRLVGWNRIRGEGRVSSAVVGLDPQARRARTTSGRTYVLEGPAGFDPDADYVLASWLCATDECVSRDATDTLSALFAEAGR